MTRIQWLGAASLILISGPALAEPPGDAVSVDPAVHRVILENEHLRIFDARAALGTKSPMHTHPPMVLIRLGKTRLRMSLPDGKSAIHDFSPGQVLWLPDGGTHSWEAIAGSTRVIAIEVKSAQAARRE